MNNVTPFKKPSGKLRSSGNSQGQPPLINLPPCTKILVLLMAGVFAAVYFLADDGDKAYIYLNFGYIPAIWTGNSLYNMDVYALISPVTYNFLHGSWMHLGMNAAMLMAFGAGVERWLGGKKFLLFFFLCGFAAVAVETVLYPLSNQPVVGASGAESGLFAAILVLLQAQGRLPTGKYGILPLAILWIGLSVIFGFVGGGLAGGQIAWAAHLGGFVAGFGLLKLRYFQA